MNRRELFIGAGALAISAALPAVAAAPVPRPFHVLTSNGLYVSTEPSRWGHPPEVQRLLAAGSVTWGECRVPANLSGSLTGPVHEQRRDVGNGWVQVIRTNGQLTSSVYVKAAKQWGPQLHAVVSA